MFGPGETANPQGRIKNDTTAHLRAALDKAAKKHKTSIFAEYAELFFTSNKWKALLLPYIVPRLRTLEVSGEVNVPFQFIIERSDGQPVELPQPVKQIPSKQITLANGSSIAGVSVADVSDKAIAKKKTKKRIRKPAMKVKVKRAKQQ